LQGEIGVHGEMVDFKYKMMKFHCSEIAPKRTPAVFKKSEDYDWYDFNIGRV
jgi:hypothetical protein